MYSQRLAQRAAENRPIRVGIIGTGKFGGGLVAQLSRMKGMTAAVIADINLDHARHAYSAAGGIPRESIQRASTVGQINDAMRTGQPVVVADGLQLIQSEVDVVVEATGIPDVGARMAYEALLNRKHVVMVNVETDVTVGALLRRMADSAGVVYTLV
ncbi:MAG: hypothetical protein KDE31_25750, partial [Caldilineaceae bacterium]|nr:hypothetical protein [Caldilineaceae bacterium]